MVPTAVISCVSDTATVADGPDADGEAVEVELDIARRSVVGMQENPITDAKEAKDPKPFVEVRSGAIGRTLDTSDDMARLKLITGYLGTKKVKVFAFEAVSDDNQISVGTGDLAPSALTYKGEFYPVVPSTATTDPSVVEGTAVDDMLDSSDVLRASAMPRKVYSHSDTDAGDPSIRYFVESSITTNEGGGTTTVYRTVDIDAPLAEVTVADDIVVIDAKSVEVTAEIAMPTDYDHIHFGVWAGLGKAEKDGAQAIANLGIGFVQNYDGMGMTGADMPNNGSATYNGDWVATVQKESTVGDGLMGLEDGAAILTANFDKDEFTAALSGLATLTGSVSGNTFAGMKVSAVTHSDLGAASAFEGSVNGGFYGSEAAEAGGVFDFGSKDDIAGAFRGAFGGKRDKN